MNAKGFGLQNAERCGNGNRGETGHAIVASALFRVRAFLRTFHKVFLLQVAKKMLNARKPLLSSCNETLHSKKLNDLKEIQRH